MTLRIARRRDRYSLGPYVLLARRSLSVRVGSLAITLAWR